MVNYCDTLANMAKSLVDNPDEVKVTETVDGNFTVLTLSVAPSDMGKVIGKNGKIAKAIRQVMKTAAGIGNKKISVDIR